MTSTGKATRASAPFGIATGDALVYESTDIAKFTLSGQYEWDQWSLTSEYTRIYGDTTLLVANTPAFGYCSHIESYWAAVTYSLTDWCELGTYFSRTNAPWHGQAGHALEARAKPHFGATNNDFALTTKFEISENLCFKLEYHNMKGTAVIASRRNSSDLENRWSVFAAKVSIIF